MGLEVFERGELPRWRRVRQHLDATEITDVAAAVAAQFARPGIGDAIKPGARVALTGGSRGIDRIAEALRAIVHEVKRRGGLPFVVAAMGSHGGATAEGQRDLLAHYGMTEAYLGAPVRSSMETVLLGQVEGDVPVWFDRIAAEEADLIIPVGRVKPHTDFHGSIESGLLKMIAIGLGKQKGADTFHSRGFDVFHRLIPAVANFTLGRMPIPFGIALVENGFARMSLVEAVPNAGMQAREQELLAIAREKMPRLPGELIDVLILDYIGKDISGIGSDTNVVNRYYNGTLPFKPRIQRMIVRDLTPETEGNASGIGLADVTLKQAADKFDPLTTYMNCITAKTPEGARLPITVQTDRQALFVALACCLRVEPQTARIARIRDTKHLEEFFVSEPLWQDLSSHPRVEPVDELRPIRFDTQGMLAE